ncbi:MAG: FmdB family transcriptional regulator [Dehalococcoidia bacterium]|nr:FmdB family transcriptional regulator [Dehalococcoidia bacterium]
MPRYDYRCTECANEFELVQKFSEAGQGECPLCGGAGQRVFHAVPVIYKGSGFYTTDYGRPKRPTEAQEAKEAATESSSTKSSGDSSDSKSSDSGSSGGSESATPAAAASGDSA